MSNNEQTYRSKNHVAQILLNTYGLNWLILNKKHSKLIKDRKPVLFRQHIFLWL